MDTKPQPPAKPSGNGNEFDKPPTPSTTPAPLANYDFDRDLDETPTTPGPLLKQQAAANSSKPAKKGGAKAFVMVLMTILLLAAIAAAGYFYWQTMEVQKQADSANREVSALTTENAKLKSDAKKTGETDKVVTPSDADQAKLAAIQYICAGTTSCAGVKTETPKLSAKNDFAKVTVLLTSGQISSQTVVYVKRVQTSQTSWVAFHGTQNGIPKSIVEKYAIPADFLDAGEVQP